MLVLAKRYTEHTRDVLYHVLEALKHRSNAHVNAQYALLAHMHLALVLQELKTAKQAQQEYISFSYVI